MANAPELWEGLLQHVSGCVRCVIFPTGQMRFCHSGLHLHAEFAEQERTERYHAHPDPAQAGMELLQARGRARIIHVTPAQFDLWLDDIVVATSRIGC